ncbi:hypothetical protein LAZ67_1001407, partial [Cordylochernes scorpioides]
MAINQAVPFRVFDSKEENFEIFVQRFEAACEANETSDQKKVVILLSLLSSDLLKLGNDLFYPEKIKEQSYEIIIKKIRQHLEPKPKVIPQRCKFLKRVQKETETVSEYLRELKHLATNCEFGSMLEMMLRDRFIAGLSSEALLQEDDDVKLDRVLAIAVSYELAEKDASELHGNCIGKVTSHSERNRRERHTPVQKYSPTAGGKRCYRCGERNSHLAPACPHKSKACYKCKKIGHLSKVCKAASNAQRNRYVQEQILSLKGETEVKVTLTLDGNVLKCVVDTGSPVTLMPKTIFKKFWKAKLFPTSKILKTLCNNPIKLVGERDVFVEEAGKKLRLIVVDEGFPEVLLGREWLKFLNINYSRLLNVNVNKVSESCIDSLIKSYANLFNNELGCLKDVKLNICIKRDAAPVFCKARSLPFAMKKKVEDELEDMVDKGILEPLDYADWAAPIVPVLKKDGRIRICGDFRSTANRAIILDKYPLPTIDEIFSKLSGSTVFSTLDLSMAYLQVELAEANGVVNINNTKGLFAYKRLPYGVAVAPNKFQRLMDNIFADIPGVACYIDDILVSGRDANEHKAKLELKLLKKNTRWKWTREHWILFRKCKSLLTNESVLTHYDPTKELVLACDASSYGLGVVLSHRDKNKQESPIAFASRTLTDAEKNYSQLEKEALSIVYGCEKFRQYLLGCLFVLVTDNRPLMHLFSSHKPIPVCAASRIKRWSLKLGAFHYSVEFRKTDDHGNADALSRLPLKAVERESIDEDQVLLLRKMNEVPFSFRDVAFETRRDKILSIVLRNVQEDNWQVPKISKENPLFPFYKIRNELSADFGCLQWREWIVIPPKLRSQILRDLHEMHFGIVRMKMIARRYFWWPGIDGNIEDMARECTICQESANMPPSTISEWTWPEKPWHRLHMDLAGPFMGRMFLVIVDAYTKWLEIFILKEITSRTIIYHLRQVFARFGLPELLVTDNGRQFVSKEFEEFTKMNGIRHTKTSPYNPSTNGLAERYVREFKTSLRKNSGKDSLETNLERFLLAQRAFPQTVMKESPAELLMKRRLKTRFSNLMPKMEFKGEAFHDALKKQENFSIGSDVYFRNYAAVPKWKQGTILKLLSCRHYLIGYEDQSFKRHINQLRPVKEKPEAAVRKDPRLVLPSTSTETLENHPEMKPSQVGLEIPERKLPEMELAEKPESTGPDLAPVEVNQSPVAVSGEKVPSRSPRPQREKPRSTRQDLAPVGDNQSPVAASEGKIGLAYASYLAASSNVRYQFKEYNEETETFETFYERLEQFLILEEAGDEKKKAYLLTLMGSKTYGVLKNLCSPILPKDKTFDNLIDILKRHFSPKRSIVVERFIFFKRMQLKEESISDYLVEIKRLASSCNFGNFLEDSLRDKMVCGLYNAKIQNRILSEGDISLAKVIEIALSMEAAEKNTKLFHLEQGDDCVDKLRMERKVESNFQNGKCKHCGKQHNELCRFKEAICFKCNKKGHIALICWSSRRNLRQHQNQPGNIHQIGDQEEEEEYVQKIISVTIPEYKINFASSDPPYLMELKVEGNIIKFEMDTGSGLTLISEKDFKNSLQHLKLEKASIIVRTYDGTVVPILGKINVKVECQDITYKLRALVVKGEKRALMGREWINRLKLGCFAVKHMPVEITIEEILKENQALFVETTEPIKGFTFSINMCDVNPIFHKARPVPFAIRPAVTEALDKMVAKGYLCEVASSKWATPVVVVPKKNKEIRICCDFKVTLNKYLDTAAYPLPTQQDLFSTLAKGKYFSKLDLRNAYLQLEVDPGTRPLLTINTHKGLFRFKRMPFGLANAPSYFQSVIDRVLSGIGGVICYIDDVLIATASIEEHLALLKTIFARLAKYNIKLKKEKCLFLQKEIEYLGHLVTEEGIRPLDHKVQAIQKAKTPTNISELSSFLGLVNFYGKFIPNLPELLKPLHELLHKKRPWVWTKECGEAIDKCKNSITSERVLVPYDATLPLCLATDASQIGVGAVLSHIIEGQERPIMFASQTLSVAEQNYSQIEKEALAIIYGVTKFHQFIYGRKFILITDHKPLVTILGSRSGIPTLSTSRLQRWALILSAYTYDIKFRRTQDHGNADLLSRFPVGCEEIPRLNNVYALSYVEELPITAEEIATETEKDEVLSLAKFYTQQGWPEKVADYLRPYFQRKLELTVDGECLVWGMRVVIPPSLRIKMLNCLHETHSGMNKMKAVARSHFWWPNLDTQIEFLVNKCRSCQQSQDGPNKGKWQPWKWSTRPWQRIHIDFANKENINLLIVVDSHSKWIEAIPMRETTTRKTIEQLRRLFSSYGLPEELVSDNGPQFTGSEMKGFLEGNGIKQTLIPAYHPQSNGLAERAVRTIKTALDKNKRKIGDTIQDTLSKVLLAYRSTPHVTTGKTPSKLFIGRALRTRVSLIHPSLASRVRDQQARQMKYDRRTHLEEFQIDDLVWCKNFRGGDKWIPGKIVGKKGTRVYTILIHGQVKAYHRDQIRKRWRNGEEDESGDGERQPEHSRGAGPSAIISEVVRDRGYMESLSPGLTSQRSDQDSEVQSDADDGKSLEPLRSLDPEALKEEGPVLRRNPPRARRPPVFIGSTHHGKDSAIGKPRESFPTEWVGRCDGWRCPIQDQPALQQDAPEAVPSPVSGLCSGCLG